MNKKGQTLIIFVILIPLIITMMAVVVDMGILIHEKTKTTALIDLGLKKYFETNDEKEIKELLELNDIDTSGLTITDDGETISVHIHYEIEAIFGKIINLNSYEIEIQRIGNKENKTLS